MSELVPRPVHLPEETIRRRPSFRQLALRVTAFTLAAVALTEGLWKLRRQMENDAKDVEHLAEMSDQAEVEPGYTALMREAAVDLRAVATASGSMAHAADEMATVAEELKWAHESEYRGVYEAVKASRVQQAKPGFYRTR